MRQFEAALPEDESRRTAAAEAVAHLIERLEAAKLWQAGSDVAQRAHAHPDASLRSKFEELHAVVLAARTLDQDLRELQKKAEPRARTMVREVQPKLQQDLGTLQQQVGRAPSLPAAPRSSPPAPTPLHHSLMCRAPLPWAPPRAELPRRVTVAEQVAELCKPAAAGPRSSRSVTNRALSTAEEAIASDYLGYHGDSSEKLDELNKS